MTDDEIRNVVIAELGRLAPEADVTHIGPEDDVREALDLDSMDILTFVTALDKRLGVAVPERDYAQVVRLASCVSYLSARVRGDAPQV